MTSAAVIGSAPLDERQRPAGERRGAGVLAGEVRGLRGAADQVHEARPRARTSSGTPSHSSMARS